MELLFRVTFRHEYFAGGTLAEASVVADSSTTQLIERYRLIPSMQEGVFSLYSNFNGGAQACISYLQQQLASGVFRFFVCADPSKFFFITELPQNWVGQLELNSSMTGKSVSGRTSLLSLLATDKVGPYEGIAILSVYFQDLLSAGGRNVQYEVDFKARKLSWYYYLINRSETVLNDPVVTQRNGYVFENTETVRLPSGENAHVFSSGLQQFPLQQIPSLIVDLVDRRIFQPQDEASVVEQVLINGLPAPRQDQLAIIHARGIPELAAVMYVYL